MRKLGILVMVMSLVFSLSIGAMAGQKLDEDDGIAVNISAAEYAKLILPNNATFNINLQELMQADQDKSMRNITLETNTTVNVDIKQKYQGDDLERVFGIRNRNKIFWTVPESDNYDKWIISPNIIVGGAIAKQERGIGYRSDTGGYNKWTNFGQLGQGSHKISLWMESNWNENADWYKFNAEETLNGQVVITVSAN